MILENTSDFKKILVMLLERYSRQYTHKGQPDNDFTKALPEVRSLPDKNLSRDSAQDFLTEILGKSEYSKLRVNLLHLFDQLVVKAPALTYDHAKAFAEEVRKSLHAFGIGSHLISRMAEQTLMINSAMLELALTDEFGDAQIKAYATSRGKKLEAAQKRVSECEALNNAPAVVALREAYANWKEQQPAIKKIISELPKEVAEYLPNPLSAALDKDTLLAMDAEIKKYTGGYFLAYKRKAARKAVWAKVDDLTEALAEADRLNDVIQEKRLKATDEERKFEKIAQNLEQAKEKLADIPQTVPAIRAVLNDADAIAELSQKIHGRIRKAFEDLCQQGERKKITLTGKEGAFATITLLSALRANLNKVDDTAFAQAPKIFTLLQTSGEEIHADISAMTVANFADAMNLPDYFNLQMQSMLAELSEGPVAMAEGNIRYLVATASAVGCYTGVISEAVVSTGIISRHAINLCTHNIAGEPIITMPELEIMHKAFAAASQAGVTEMLAGKDNGFALS